MKFTGSPSLVSIEPIGAYWMILPGFCKSKIIVDSFTFAALPLLDITREWGGKNPTVADWDG